MAVPEAHLLCNRCSAEWHRPALVTVANWDAVVGVTLHVIDHLRAAHEAEDEAVATERWLLDTAAMLGVAPPR